MARVKSNCRMCIRGFAECSLNRCTPSTFNDLYDLFHCHEHARLLLAKRWKSNASYQPLSCAKASFQPSDITLSKTAWQANFISWAAGHECPWQAWYFCPIFPRSHANPCLVGCLVGSAVEAGEIHKGFHQHRPVLETVKKLSNQEFSGRA